MMKKFLNIALIFTLLLAVTGYSSSASICQCFKKEEPKKCCKKKSDDKREENKCCKITILYRLNSDLSVSNTETHIPDFDLTVSPLFTFNEPVAVSIDRSGDLLYSPPPQVRDIPVLIQCFRN